MAHELEFVNGVVQMAFVGETPWHGLGAQVADDLAPAEMMKAAGVDWRVQEVDTFAEFNGNKVPTGMKALIRETDGRVLTQVGKGWHPVQNEEAFEFFKDFTDAGKMKMHTVIPARQQYKNILVSLETTSHPWLTWKDSINVRALNNNTGTIHCSNLCTEVTLPTDRENISVCNLISINIARHIVGSRAVADETGCVRWTKRPAA